MSSIHSGLNRRTFWLNFTYSRSPLAQYLPYRALGDLEERGDLFDCE